MSTQGTLWKLIEHCFDKSSFKDVETLVDSLTRSQIHLKNVALLARKFAELHLKKADPDLGKVRGYALCATYCYLELGESALATKTYKWIASFQVIEPNLLKELKTHITDTGLYKKTGTIERPKLMMAPPPAAAFAPLNQFKGESISSDITDKISEEALQNARSTAFLSALSPEQLSRILKTARPKVFKAGSVVFEEGQPAEACFVVVSGEVEIKSSTNLKLRLGVGEFFGELAIMARIKRTATVRCQTDCQLLEFPNQDFYALLKKYPDLEKHILGFYEFRLFSYRFRKLSLLKDLNDKDLRDIFNLFKTVRAEPGKLIARQGDPSDALYFILNGALHIEQDEKHLALRGPGDFVGEAGLLRGQTRSASIVGATESLLLQCKREDLSTLFNRVPELTEHLRLLMEKRAEPQAPSTRLG